MKGLGIILVIATHSPLSIAYPKLLKLLATGYMAMFFILSGYTTKKEAFGPAIKKKAMRLLIPYIFYGVVITFLFSITGLVRNSTNEWIGLLYSRYAIYPLQHANNTFLLRTTSPLWFLTAMFMAYTWFYSYVNLKKATHRNVCIALYIAATIALHDIGVLLPWSIDTSFLCALFIIVGYKFSSYATTVYRKRFKYFATLSILLGIYITIVTYNGSVNLSVGYYGNLGTLSIFLYFMLSIIFTILYSEILKLSNNKITHFLAFVGKHSLRLMCIHFPLIVLLGPLFTKMGVFGKFATFISAFIISLGTSMAIEKIRNRYAGKYPMLRFI